VSTTKKWDELFYERRWRVGEEYTGAVRDGGVTVTFDRGRFSIEGGAYQSPLSTNRGRHGVLLIETDAGGAADLAGPDGRKVKLAVGEPAVKRARDEFGAVW
jgi:hypothetical protein